MQAKTALQNSNRITKALKMFSNFCYNILVPYKIGALLESGRGPLFISGSHLTSADFGETAFPAINLALLHIPFPSPFIRLEILITDPFRAAETDFRM